MTSDPFAYDAGEQPRVTVTPTATTTSGSQGGGDAFGLHTGQTNIPAPTHSGLALYRKRAQALRESRYIDLLVPDSGDVDNPGDPRDTDAVWVRYRALTKSEMTAVGEKWDKADVPLAAQEWGMAVDALTTACVGVFQVDDTGLPIGSPGSWPRFGPDLAEQMGIPLGGTPTEQASQLLKEFYVADVDAINTADKIANYSNRVQSPVVERQNPEA